MFGSFALVLCSANAAQPVDGITQIFRDELLDRMTGTWILTGSLQGRPANHSVEVRWILNHQFLEIREKDKTAAGYEALALLGRDNMSERYVVHWNDVFGGRFSETLGYGARSGDEITLVFEYPDGPFRTTMRWLADKKQWEWVMRTKNDKGQWEDFGRMTLTRE